MNKHQFIGRFKELKGRVNEIVARRVYDRPFNGTDRLQKIAGRIQASFGDLKDRIQKGR